MAKRTRGIHPEAKEAIDSIVASLSKSRCYIRIYSDTGAAVEMSAATRCSVKSGWLRYYGDEIFIGKRLSHYAVGQLAAVTGEMVEVIDYRNDFEPDDLKPKDTRSPEQQAYAEARVLAEVIWGDFVQSNAEGDRKAYEEARAAEQAAAEALVEWAVGQVRSLPQYTPHATLIEAAVNKALDQPITGDHRRRLLDLCLSLRV